MPERSPLIDESRQAPAPKPARPLPWKSVFVYYERFIQNAPRWSEGAVSQAVADPILTHMWTISVGARSLHGRAAECSKRFEAPPLLAHSQSESTLKSSRDCRPLMVV